MILYSVTVAIDEQIAAEWLEWMQAKHIPDVLNTGLFESHRVTELLDPPAEAGTRTFNIQYVCKSLEALEEYQAQHAPGLQAEHTERYQNRFAAFRTILKIVGE